MALPIVILAAKALVGVKSFIVWLYSKIGITGMVIIILLLLSGYQYMIIGDKNKEITKAKTDLSILTERVKIQNEKIKEFGIVRDNIQKQVDLAEKANKKLTSEYKILKDIINREPIALTCEDAMAEVRNSAASTAKRWNKQ